MHKFLALRCRKFNGERFRFDAEPRGVTVWTAEIGARVYLVLDTASLSALGYEHKPAEPGRHVEVTSRG
jgi:hypothetical protein